MHCHAVNHLTPDQMSRSTLTAFPMKLFCVDIEGAGLGPALWPNTKTLLRQRPFVLSPTHGSARTLQYIWTHHRETKSDGEGGSEEPVGEQGSLRGSGKHLTFWPHCFPLSCSSFKFHQASTL